MRVNWLMKRSTHVDQNYPNDKVATARDSVHLPGSTFPGQASLTRSTSFTEFSAR